MYNVIFSVIIVQLYTTDIVGVLVACNRYSRKLENVGLSVIY